MAMMDWQTSCLHGALQGKGGRADVGQTGFAAVSLGACGIWPAESEAGDGDR